MITLRRAPKKERERQLLDAFLKLCGTDASVESEGESPDFVLAVQGRAVGVEITEVYVPNDGNKASLKARESLAAKVVSEARAIHEAAGGVPLHVAIGFTPQTDFGTLKRTATARAIADFLLQQSFSSGAVQMWGSSFRGALPHGIHFLNVYVVSERAAAHWYAPHAGWVVPLTEDLLQASIDEKTQKLAEYRKKAPEIWLVLAIAGGAPSQGFDFGHTIDCQAIISPFDRTFLLSLIDGTVKELGAA